jgi:hypothetical protein
MTEFHQPINPMRVSVGNGDERSHCLVFAIAISNQDYVEYLTIYGQFISRDRVSLVEVCINGQWTV